METFFFLGQWRRGPGLGSRWSEKKRMCGRLGVKPGGGNAYMFVSRDCEGHSLAGLLFQQDHGGDSSSQMLATGILVTGKKPWRTDAWFSPSPVETSEGGAGRTPRAGPRSWMPGPARLLLCGFFGWVTASLSDPWFPVCKHTAASLSSLGFL